MVERHMVSMAQQPARPVPPGGYRQRFGEPGAQAAVEFKLTDIDEPGHEAIYTAFGVSSANRVRQLLLDSVEHLATPDGQRGFVHPVVLVCPEHYHHQGQGREIHTFGYRIVDWISDNGELLSKHPATQDGPVETEAAPWDVE